SRHALMCRELFGPVIALVHAPTFDRALEIANESAYKLTGAVFSRSPVNLETARKKFRVGNLYLNRGSTGSQQVGLHIIEAAAKVHNGQELVKRVVCEM